MPPNCQACNVEVPPEQLQLTEAGQWVCRSCGGQYAAMQATRRARRADNFRRCRCSRVMTPMGDPEIKPREDNSLNLEFLFQPRVYRCSCGERLRAPHPVMLGLIGVIGAYHAVVGYIDRNSDASIWALGLGVSVLGYVAYKVVQLARYPRVF